MNSENGETNLLNETGLLTDQNDKSSNASLPATAGSLVSSTTGRNTRESEKVKYFNRELSFIEFNKRVLDEAEGRKHPLLERLKFIAILSSNLDEFFMIRVSGLKRQAAAGIVELSFDGMTPEKQLKEIRDRLIPLYKRQEEILLDEILPLLEKENIFIDDYDEISDSDKIFLKNYFNDCVMPVLTPMSLDSAHPFPRLINRSLNISFLLDDETVKDSERKVAFLQIPSALARLVQLPANTNIEGTTTVSNKELELKLNVNNTNRKTEIDQNNNAQDCSNGCYRFVLLEQIIKANADELFPGLKIITTNTFRVTRDADFEIAEDEAEDLLTEIAEHLKLRRWGTAAVRLEVNESMEPEMIKFLKESLELETEDIYLFKRPLNLPDFLQLLKLDKRDLKDIPFQTRYIPEFRNPVITGENETGIFEAIRNKDFMVHHPYDSFSNSILKLLNQAADDADVLAIKITLYRVGMKSPVVAALKRAAENGKNVTAFVELKARFDEENNIIWAKELEQVGVHVVYGVLHLKTHCKIAIIVRKEGNKLNTYLHLSTGNYNHSTSRLYTDVGFFTSNKEFSREANYLFNYLTGYSYYKEWKHFFVAPVNLRRSIIELINRETERHSKENPGLIIVKMNSLADTEVINALYRASKRGVTIQMQVRGVCCLKPGIPGLSENIEVRSILGRFLEHSRAFYFKNGGHEEFYLSSADWMTRNLHKRVELMFPIYDESLKLRLKSLLEIYWKDNIKSWRLLSDGSYEKIHPSADEKPFSAQEFYLNEVRRTMKRTKPHLTGSPVQAGTL